jgi:hypothetical protein
VLSDWHVEETVTREQTAGLNAFDLEVADLRIAELARRIGVLVEHERQLVKIDRIVIAALGDFISGHIHEELVETCSLAPMAATRWAAARLRGIVDMAADMAREVIVVTQPGNHGRSNHGKPRKATEHDHSFEQNAYLMMAAGETRPNVRWEIAAGYLGYLDLDGFVVRYHHGHEIRYQGGVGGITIPVNKAIDKWNRSRPANLDIFGHWHQWGWLRGKYVSNGSLIGMTYLPEQEVLAWHRHQLGGDYYGGPPIVEGIACMPGTGGTFDELWMVVKRTINGSVTRYIEVMEKYFDDQLQEQAVFMDSSLSSAVVQPAATLTASAATGAGVGVFGARAAASSSPSKRRR